jgi:hypothetical protein
MASNKIKTMKTEPVTEKSIKFWITDSISKTCLNKLMTTDSVQDTAMFRAPQIPGISFSGHLNFVRGHLTYVYPQYGLCFSLASGI